MARVFREPDGRYYAIKTDGTKVLLPPGYEKNIILHSNEVDQTQGVTSGERFFLKNFDTAGPSGNVDSARQWLENRGYETRRLDTNGFNFAVRKQGDQGPWKVLDPDTGIFSKDFISDMTDLTSDALLGLGAGLTGGIGAAALVGGGGELAKEAIGSFGGLEDNISPLQVGLQAGAAAAAPLVGRGVKAGLRAVAATRAGKAAGNFLSESAAKIAGVKPLMTEGGLMSPGATLREFASQPAGTTYESVKGVAQKLQGMVRAAWKAPMGEKIRLNHMLKNAAAEGQTADFRGALENLTKVAPEVGETVNPKVAFARGKESDLPQRAAAEIQNIYQTIADAQGTKVENVDLSKVPIHIADRVKTVLQNRIDQLNGYKSYGNLDLARPQLASVMQGTAHEMRAAVADVMDRWGGKMQISNGGQAAAVDKFSYLYNRLATRISELHNISKATGALDKENSREGLKKAITFIRQTVGDMGPEALRNFEKQFPVQGRGAASGAFKANLAEAVAGKGSKGIPANFARFSAVGQPIGAPIIGAGIGATFGGLPGAAAGALGASALFSPKAMVGATRAITGGLPSLPRAALGARLAATAALQTAARQASMDSKRVASEASPKKDPARKAYFVGR